MAKFRDNIFIYLLKWIRVFAELSVAIVDRFRWCVFSQCRCLWFFLFGINKLENSDYFSLDYILALDYIIQPLSQL